jgi:HEAT repeat protein
MNTKLVAIIAAAEVAIFLLAYAAVIARALRVRATDRLLASRTERARTALVTALVGTDGGADEGAVDALRALPGSRRIDAVARLTAGLSGESREHLDGLAEHSGLRAPAVRDTRSRRWPRRLAGARLLTLLDGTPAEMGPLLDDPRPEVRAQAAEWASEHPDPDTVERLVAMLGDPAPTARFSARDSLVRMGSPAADALGRTLPRLSGTTLAVALEVAAAVAEPHLLAPALDLARRPDVEVRTRAVTLLGALGGESAVAALERALGDQESDVRAAAATALADLAHWPAAPALARMLEDPAWDCRRAAGLGLLRLGEPGRLLLNRALDSDDRFAADMARHVMDLPE